jgi:T5SS/PEP-CTERM-associated repeat protein
MNGTIKASKTIQPAARRVLRAALAGNLLALLLLAPPGASGAVTNLFVANNGNNTIEEYNMPVSGPPTPTVFSSSALLNYPVGLAFDANGNLYVANNGNNTIVEYANGVSTAGSVIIPSTAGLDGPEGIAFDSAGNLYVANDGGAIVRFSKSGGVWSGSTVANVGNDGPQGLAFDANGYLYVAESGGSPEYSGGWIQYFKLSSGVWTSQGDYHSSGVVLAAPVGLAFDGAGNLYVSDPGYPTIVKFAGGVWDVNWTTCSDLNYPWGLAFDNSGILYDADAGNPDIDTFNSSGGCGSPPFATAGLNQPAFLAIWPPPSPGPGTPPVPGVNTTNSWINSGSGKWETAANWSSGSAPSKSDSADLITNVPSKLVTIDAATVLSNALNGCMTISNLYIIGTTSSGNTLYLNNIGVATPLQVIGTAGVLTLDAYGALWVNDSAVVLTNGSTQLIVGNDGNGGSWLEISNGGAVHDSEGVLGIDNDNNLAEVTGTGAVWSNNAALIVGLGGSFNQMDISDGGAVVSSGAAVGGDSFSSNNIVLITDPGSVWSNPNNSALFFGEGGAGNQMIISNGGAMYNGVAYVGSDNSASNNIVLIAGAGSVWNNSLGLSFGEESAGNQMIISNGGAVYNAGAVVGSNNSASNNIVLITGTGSVWSNWNNSITVIGEEGAGNQMIISNGGAVCSSGNNSGDSVVGYDPSGSDNIVLITGHGSIWNSSTLSFGEQSAGNQMIISDGGALYSAGAYVGEFTSASNNIMLITGAGSVWNSGSDWLYFGFYGAGNQMIISNGGGVVSGHASWVGLTPSGSNNIVLVTGTGSVWTNLELGFASDSAGNQMIITNGGAVYTTGNGCSVGSQNGGNSNTVLVSGNGALWSVPGGAPPYGLAIGSEGGCSNQCAIGTGGSVIAGNVYIGYSDSVGSSTNNVIEVNGGSLTADGPLVVSEGGGMGAVMFNGGWITVNQLVLTNGVNSVFTFNAGTLTSGGTFVTNDQRFVVGDGTHAATFQSSTIIGSGMQDFANGIEINNNAIMNGCGVINSPSTVNDVGGAIVVSLAPGICDPLTFTGIVTNNGSIVVVNGASVNFVGQVVNNGVINAINGSPQFLGGLVNNGCVLTEEDAQISSITRSGNDIIIQIPSAVCATYQLQVNPSLNPATWENQGASQPGTGDVLTFTDTGGAENPARYYRIDIDITVP